MNEPTLAVLAAGLGARFGGAKQFFELGPAGETFADYSLYDAWRAGFKRAVFIVRNNDEPHIERRYAERWKKRVEIQCAVQRLDDLPAGLTPPAARQKPWGTIHALWCARKFITAPFGVVNADDFYGQAPFAAVRQFLQATLEGAALVSYPAGATLSDWGGVARAFCRIDEQGWLKGIQECRGVKRVGEKIISDGDAGTSWTHSDPVSMNFWAFASSKGAPRVLDLLEPALRALVASAASAPEAELPISEAASQWLRDGALKVRTLAAGQDWIGMTYREDAQAAAQRLRALSQAGHYPSPLWSAE